MQAIADAHLLEVAEPGVEGDERLLGRLVIGGAFLEEPAVAALFENERRNGARAARIERLRFGEFVKQRLKLERCAMRPGGDQWRSEMADRDRADATLGLRGFAGIVDNERIDDRRRPEQNFGRAILAERDRLAGQPFERAMRAELNDRVDVLLAGEPEIEGDIGVARRQVEIVIVALARGRVAAVGLNRDDELARAARSGTGTPRRSSRGHRRGSPHAANKDCRKSAGVEASSASYSANVSAAPSGPCCESRDE